MAPSTGLWRRALILIRSRPTASLLAVVCAVGAAFVLRPYLVRDEQKELLRCLNAVRDAVVAGDVSAVMARVSPDFYQDGVDAEHLQAYLGRVLPALPVSRAALVPSQWRIRGAIATLTLVVESGHPGARGRTARSEWVVALERAGDRWLLNRAAPVAVEGVHGVGLRSVLLAGIHP